MNRSDKLALAIATKALRNGTDPQLVVAFLEAVLDSDPDPDIAEIMRPGGTT